MVSRFADTQPQNLVSKFREIQNEAYHSTKQGLSSVVISV